jgi:protein tyrosine/serine phosphatase
MVLASLIAAFALVAPWNAQALTITPDQAGLTNFGQVNENYFRGAQPDQKAIQRLDALGIKTVIDLQEQGVPAEPGWVQTAGMQYFNIPLSGSRPATEAQTARFLELVNDPQNWPVYVHCKVGKHRTGEMTGIYRITHDTWTADRAYGEMKQFGYYSFPNHGSLKDYVYKYYDTNRAALAAKASASSGSSGVASASGGASTSGALSESTNP